MNEDRVFIGQTPLAIRWGKSPRTILRWRELGRIPPPELYLSQQPNWRMETILKLEEEMQRRAVEAPPKFPSTAKALTRCAKLAAARAARKARTKAAKLKRAAAARAAAKANAVKPARKAVKPTRKATGRGAR
jgi:hypothetical protein